MARSPPKIGRMALETSEMDRYDKMLLLVNRWLAQIHLVAPGGPSKEAKAVFTS